MNDVNNSKMICFFFQSYNSVSIHIILSLIYLNNQSNLKNYDMIDYLFDSSLDLKMKSELLY